MKKVLTAAFLFVLVTTAECQQLYFNAGKNISSFSFKNIQGEKLENLNPTNHTFMSIGYRRNIFTKNLFVNGVGSFNTYGCVGSDNTLKNYFEWEASYLGANLSLDYVLYKINDFSFYVNGATSVEFMVQGTQNLNNYIYSLPGNRDFKSPIYFFRGGLGAQYDISEKVTLFAQYSYGRGNRFRDKQGDLKINSHSFGIGMLIDIAKKGSAGSAISSYQTVELKKTIEENKKMAMKIEEKKQQVDSLQNKIVAKDEEIVTKTKEMKTLKQTIADALFPFKGKGLQVEERDGKVFVTMENDMIFKPGSWTVDPEGEKAVNALGTVLAANPDVSVQIEGHTDNEPYKGNGNIDNNWDLSTKRATSIVEILGKQQGVDPKNLTAAGKGEYDPVADNTTVEGRAKNRRIEIILTPKIEEVLKLIKQE